MMDARVLPKGYESLVSDLLDVGGQDHLFEGLWDDDVTSASDRDRLLRQMKSLDEDYAGGLAKYVRNARELLKGTTKKETNNRVEIPKGTVLVPGKKSFERAEKAGLECIDECAFVLVAGGRGERLGYDGIKVELACETTTWKCYLQVYVEHILALQRLSNAKHPIPLAIMTSESTHNDTKRLLETNRNFGAAPGQIILMQQKGVASLTDPTARIALDPTDRFRILTKPHGHGDVHSLLLSSGLAERWTRESRKFCCFLQDTQGYLVFKSLPAVIGTCKLDNASMTTMCVSRRAGDAQGAICTLVNSKNSKDRLTINVEYNLLDQLLRANNNMCDQNDPKTGYSPYPGNTNCICISLKDYVSTLKRTNGIVPEFVNPKYDETRLKFKKPTRLECMMQDYPKLLPQNSKVTFCLLPRWLSYSPVKNSMDSAVSRVRRGLSGACVVTGESDTYLLHAQQLRLLGVRCEKNNRNVVGRYQVPIVMTPNVIWSPSFAPTFTTLSSRFPSPSDVYISKTSSLSLELEDDTCELVVKKLNLRGALRVVLRHGARVVLDGLKVSNKGWNFETFDDDDDDDLVTSNSNKEEKRRGEFSGMYVRKVETDVLVVNGMSVSWNRSTTDCPTGIVLIK